MSSQTQRVTIDSQQPDPGIIEQAAQIIRQGGLVAFPTETVYGLGADALNASAAQGIFLAKGRPANDPLIVHVADASWLDALASEIPAIAWQLAEQFWPGPLTLVLRKRPQVPDVVTASGATVAIRAPRHPIAQALIQHAQTPIAAPSANRFSHTSPTTAQHVWDDLNGRIEMILDGGATAIGVESTVLDVTGAVPVLLRPGGVPLEALTDAIGEVQQRTRNKPGEVMASPGLLDKHYAPTAGLWLFRGEAERVRDAFLHTLHEQQRQGRRVGLLLTEEDALDVSMIAAQVLPAAWTGTTSLDNAEDNAPERFLVIESLGAYGRLEEVAQRLFAAMRALDAAGVDLILAHEFPAHGLGLAINDRLKRAAERVIEV